MFRFERGLCPRNLFLWGGFGRGAKPPSELNMRGFEDTIASELAWLLRAGAPPRAVRLTVREVVVARIERGPLDARQVSDAVESTVRAACRLLPELDASGTWSRPSAGAPSRPCEATAARPRVGCPT